MIFVTVGTHEAPFDRLVIAADTLAQELKETVVLQKGTSKVYTPSCENRPYFPQDVFSEYLQKARIVITHTGPATVDQLFFLGRLPIVVPRDPRFGEHVDEHQIEFSEHLRERAIVTCDPGSLKNIISSYAVRYQEWRERWPQGPPFAGWSMRKDTGLSIQLEEVVKNVLRRPRRPWYKIRAT